MSDLISREEVLNHQFTFVDESGIGLSYYDVVGVSNIKKMPTVNAIVIPDGATIGDMIKAILPNADIRADSYLPSVNIYVDGVMVMRVDKDLWNAPYKKEVQE